MALLPDGICLRLAAVPVRRDPVTGTVDVAVLDARDEHAAQEIGHHLHAPVRIVRASLDAIRDALELYPGGVRALAPPMGAPGSVVPSTKAPSTLAGPPSIGAPPTLAGPPPSPGDVARGTVGSTPTAAAKSAGSSPLRGETIETLIWGVPAVSPMDAASAASRVPPHQSQTLVPAVHAAGDSPAGAGDAAEGADGTPIPLSRRANTMRITGAWEDASVRAEPVRVRARGEPEPIFELRRAAPASISPRFKPSSGPPPPAFPLLTPLGPQAPTAPNAPIPPFADAATFLAGLKAAPNRDAVVRGLLDGARAVARKAGVLVARRDTLEGWTCTPELADPAAFKALRISTVAPSMLTSILSGGMYLGPLLGSVGAALLTVMKSATDDVAICAVRVTGRPALVVVADELGDTALSTRRIEELARASGEALERLLRAKR